MIYYKYEDLVSSCLERNQQFPPKILLEVMINPQFPHTASALCSATHGVADRHSHSSKNLNFHVSGASQKLRKR